MRSAVFWTIWQNCTLAPPGGWAPPPTGNPEFAPSFFPFYEKCLIRFDIFVQKCPILITIDCRFFWNMLSSASVFTIFQVNVKQRQECIPVGHAAVTVGGGLGVSAREAVCLGRRVSAWWWGVCLGTVCPGVSA